MKRVSGKERRRIRQARNLGITISLFLSIILLAFLYIGSIFNIQNIETSGNHKTSSSALINGSGIRFGENIFKVSTKEAEENLLKLPYVKTASVTREKKNTIRITVVEREEVFSILSNGVIFTCDRDGRILAKSKTTSVYPIVKGIDVNDSDLGLNIFEENEDIEPLRDIITTAIDMDIIDKYLEIRLQKNKEFGLTRVGNIKIDFGKSERIKNKFNFIEKTLESLEAKGKTTTLIKLNMDPPVTFLKDGEKVEE